MEPIIEVQIRPRINALSNRDPKYGVKAHYAAVREYQKRTVTSDGRPAAEDVRKAATAAAFEVIEQFEQNLEAHLAESARRRQEAFIVEQQQAVATARARAQAFARANPMRPSEIQIAVERLGYRIRLRKGSIEVAPSTGLALELEMQVVEHARELRDYLKSRETWRQIAIVPTDDVEAVEAEAL